MAARRHGCRAQFDPGALQDGDHRRAQFGRRGAFQNGGANGSAAPFQNGGANGSAAP
jgi:hypothetical protein